MVKKREIPTVHQYPVVVTNQGIWLVRPENHQKVRIASADEILDSYISDRGIYHAVENHDYETKMIGGSRKHRRPRSFKYNFVSIIDSLTGKQLKNIYPEGQRQMPVEERLVDIDFGFERNGDALAYVFNGSQGQLFDTHAAPSQMDMSYNHNGSRLYFCGRRVARFDRGERIKNLNTLSVRKLERLLRRKNPSLLQRFKELGGQ